MEPAFRIFFAIALSIGSLAGCGGGQGTSEPTVTIESPSDGVRFHGPTVKITGLASPGSQVSILGGPTTYAGNDGSWETELAVAPGGFVINASATLGGVEGPSDSVKVTRVRTARERTALARRRAVQRQREQERHRAAARRERQVKAAAARRAEEAREAAKWIEANRQYAGPAVGECEAADTGAALLLRGSVTSGIKLALSEDAVSVTVGSLTYIATPLYNDRSFAVVGAYRTGGDQLDMRAVNGFAQDNTDLPRGGSQAGIDAALDCLP